MTIGREAGRVDTSGVWREFRGRLLGYITTRVDTPEDAEDILQEVMLRIHRNRDELDRVQKISSWVYRVTSNAITDYYRRPARRELPAGADVDPADADRAAPVVDDGDADIRAELARCLRPMIDHLPTGHAQALRLTEFEGMTQTAAAAHLGLSVSGLKSRVQRARRQLKQLLLDCCHVDVDTRGGVTDFRTRDAGCLQCPPATSDPAAVDGASTDVGAARTML